MLVFLQKRVGLLLVLLALAGTAMGQSLLRGTVTEPNGDPVIGATVLVKGTTNAAPTNVSGQYELKVAPGSYQIVISSVGFTTQTLSATVGAEPVTLNVTLKADAQALGEVTVVGYGAVQKQDQTGAVAVLTPKEFNQGVFTAPDQLIQGRVSGVQLTSASGQPGGASTVRIRGNSTVTGTGQPLYVVDGIPLDGRTARPGDAPGNTGTSLGSSPDSNPLNFLNPNDIESMTILKDASATAIYGSRAAYGVVLITTKRSKGGATRVDFNLSAGFSQLSRRLPVLTGDEFRQALGKYGVATQGNDFGSSVDAIGAITRTAPVQNYNVAISGGNDNSRFRLSLGYLDQQGIVRKTDFKKFSANLFAGFTFLESKRIGIDININTSQFQEQLAPISNDAGFQGSLIGQALQWNPTNPLRQNDGSLTVPLSSSIVNPLAISEYYNDNSRVTTILANASPYWKVTDWLTARATVAANYATGIRRTSIDQRTTLQDIVGLGYASIGTTELLTQQGSATLTADKKLTEDLTLNALVGYEYTNFQYSGTNMRGFGVSGVGLGTNGLDYTNFIQYTSATGRNISSFADPNTALQSVFGRAILNYKDRYLLTGTVRSDGSTKFGSNYRTGYFPSFSAAWDVAKEGFWTVSTVNQFKIRGGYGRTGNQEYPAGASQNQISFLANGSLGQITTANPDLRWQSDAQYNIGFDLGFLQNRFTLTADYFHKTTTSLLFPNVSVQPAPPGGVLTWVNLPGQVINQGFEIGGSFNVADNPEGFGLTVNANATFIQNNVTGLPASFPTGALNGQGLSGVFAETIANGLPINSFRSRQFLGIDPTTGQANYASDAASSFIVGNPNPKALGGLGFNARYRKLSLNANFTGVFGNQIYNNTLNSVLNVSQLATGRNIATTFFNDPVQESINNRITASSRFIESGSYVRLSNLSLGYAVGNIGTYFKNIGVFATGQNLFIITNYKGFDPDVNTNKVNTANLIPSVGIDYIGYPPSRTFTFGVNASF